MRDGVVLPGNQVLQGAIVAFAALVLGAVAMGISPVFVRLAEVGPFASAFWRVCGALPVLWLWSHFEKNSRPTLEGWSPAVVLTGILFAGDLFCWHLAILNTTIANATFLGTLAPIWVLAGSSLFLGERPTRNMWMGGAACIVGGVFLIGANLGLAPERFLGDLFGLATSVFFGAYILSTRFVRRNLGPGGLVFRSSVVTAIVLLVIALVFEDRLLPDTWRGYVALAVIALVAHVCGQGLLTFALGTLTAGFSALVIFLEAITAALFAWLMLGEVIVAGQIVGGVLILGGIWIARPGAGTRSGLRRSTD